MANHILVFAEHQGGKLTRPTWEVLAAAQHLAQGLGTTVTAVLLGSNLASLAADLATAAIQEILTVDSPLLAEYTADGYTLALRAVIEQQKPRIVVFSHTYQVRDFAPKLAASLDRGLVSDCLAYRNEEPRAASIVPSMELRLTNRRRDSGFRVSMETLCCWEPNDRLALSPLDSYLSF